MNVFISSVIEGMEECRDAAADAVSVLGHSVVRAEEFGASAVTPRIACLDAVRESDAVVLILGPRYGYVQPSGLSATHEEYREARDKRPVLAMVQRDVDFEDRQQEFRDEVQDWESGQYTRSFSSPTELKDAVTRALHDLEVSQAVGSVDSSEILGRALESLEQEDGYYQSGPRLAIAIASGPVQNVLRPGKLESSELQQDLVRAALFGSNPIFTYQESTETKVDGEQLLLEQDGRSLCLYEDGTIDLTASLRRTNTGLNVIIEEDVKELIESFVEFATDILDQVDATHRLSHSVVVANLLNVRQASWRTRAEEAQNPNSMTVSWGIMSNSGVDPVHLNPPEKTRSGLRPSASDIAEDLTVLLRRQLSG